MAVAGAKIEKTLGVGGNAGRGMKRGGITYGSKAMMASRRLNSDINNATVRNFERGGAKKVETSSSLKVVSYEIIGGKKFKVIR